MTPTRIALAAALLLGGAATVAVARPHGGHEGPFGWDRFVENHDKDGDGAVSREELASTAADERFARLDADGDGRVTEEEFRGALAGRVLGHMAFRADADRDGALTRAEWSAFLAELDEDGDGTLELRHHRHRGPAAEGDETQRVFPGDADGDGAFETDEAEALFARFDANGDGVVSEEELPSGPGPGRHGRFHHGPRGRHGDPAAFLGRLDTDGDGSVSRAEWDAHVEGRGEARAERHGEMFERLDADSDGALSREEIESFHPRGHRGRR
jgi:Ca2+-binding EF-hand superfamily protein